VIVPCCTITIAKRPEHNFRQNASRSPQIEPIILADVSFLDGDGPQLAHIAYAEKIGVPAMSNSPDGQRSRAALSASISEAARRE
jgi:hypothetical protein